MKTYTQQDFDTLVREVNGYLYCPTGDWSNVKFGGAANIVFAAGCKLGYGCKLGDRCELGDGCKLGSVCALGDECTLGD